MTRTSPARNRILSASFFLLLGGTFGGCTAVWITPASLRTAAVADANAKDALARWQKAVGLANAFLDSPWRRTLPPGKFMLSEAGMIFRTLEKDWPVNVRVTPIGDWCVRFGFVAQERSDGFVVGRVPPQRSALLDNSFFLGRNGKSVSTPAMASLLLHETTHEIFREGTVSFWAGIAYYGEAALTWKYRTLRAERRPFATSEEFQFFIANQNADAETQAKLRREFETHLAQGPTKYCRHGPFPTVPAAESH
jgi:hypothetical protein